MPRVSIISPTYNRAGVLSETIDSVLEQTIDDFEYIIVDDGSTDSTEDVVRSYNDTRVSYIRLSGNQGANVARNRGIERASGRYISFLDSDDWYLPNRLERTVDVLDKLPDDICGVTHSFESIISGEVVRRSTMSDGRITAADLRSGNVVGGFSNVLFRANVFDEVGKLDEEMPSYQDYEFYLRAIEVGDIYGINEVLCKKRKRSVSESSERISNDVGRKIRGQELLEEKHGDSLSEKVRASFYYTQGRLHMDGGDVVKGRRAFWNAMTTYPYHPLYYYNFVASLGGQRTFRVAQRVKRKTGVVLSRF